MSRDEVLEQVEQARNEECYCGHLRVNHADTIGGLAVGHGKCNEVGCPCSKFTWKRFIGKVT